MIRFHDVHLFIHSRIHSVNLTELLPREQAQYEAPGIRDGSISPLLQGPLVGRMVLLSPWATGIF